ncbi:MAG: hypothetical protein HY067_02020 [Betaproteobacteria bacterium]|nr:hypothetical protein [Betaproteobacteria bacterium]
MKIRNFIAAIIAGLMLISAVANAQSWSPPLPGQRCPSKWGATDDRGAANLLTPESVLNASRLIRTGEVVELGRVLAMDMPLFGTRRFDIHSKRTGGPMGSNKRYTNEELVISEIGQVGTQFDMFSHQSIDNSHYNCFATDDITTRNGFTKLGVEKSGQCEVQRRWSGNRCCGSRLGELAVKKAYEFVFVVQPLKIKGGTGSTVAPIAIR